MTDQTSTEPTVYFFNGKVIDISGPRWVTRAPKADEDVSLYPVLSATTVSEALDSSRSTLVEGKVKAVLQDAIVMEVQALPKVWEQLGEDAQKDVIARADARITDLLQDVVPLLTNAEYPVITGTLGDVTAKPTGIAAKLTFPSSAADRFAFFDAVGQKVSVSMLDPRDFMAEEAEIQATADQRHLFNEDGTGEHKPPEETD